MKQRRWYNYGIADRCAIKVIYIKYKWELSNLNYRIDETAIVNNIKLYNATMCIYERERERERYKPYFVK